MYLYDMILSFVALYALLLGPALAYWRMSCMGVSGIGRIDPIIAPNQTSAHVHTLKGSGGVSPSATTDDLLNGDCTSCEIAQDKSAYWSPQMYFYDSDEDSYEAVPEVQGHITYYKNVPATLSNGSEIGPIAVPNGMKMVSGNAMRRNFTLSVPDPLLPWDGEDATQDALQQKAIGFNCLNYEAKPEGTLERHFLPDKSFLETKCPDGIRLEVLFPICWNGKDLESSSNDHVAYSDAGANGGRCPEGYDVVINQLLFETIYPTQNYVGKNGFYTLANGDPTGYGYHGDAFIAWEGDSQQKATDLCGSPDHGPGAQGIPSQCPVFDIQSVNAQSSCKLKAPGNVQVQLAAPLSALPGANPIQSGPEQATMASTPGAGAPPSTATPTSATSSSSSFTSVSLKNKVQATNTMATSASVSTPVASPATTPEPSSSPSPDQKTEWSTTTYTAGGAVNVIVEEIVVVPTTVFASPPAASPTGAAKRRRHMDAHAHGRFKRNHGH